MGGSWQRFVAVGDSLTEGLGDPDTAGGWRGWADRFAVGLAEHQGGLQYANLAVRGLTTAQVAADQLEPALALAPDLVSVFTGMNDLIRPTTDLPAVTASLVGMVDAFTATGATVLMCTLPDPSVVVAAPNAVRRRFSARLAAFNRTVVTVAEQRGAHCLDLAAQAETDRGGWSDDRLHPGPYGHQLLADGFLTMLTGSPSGDPAETPSTLAATDGLLAKLRWLSGTVAPWVLQRFTGRGEPEVLVAKLPRYLALPTLSPADSG